MQNSREPIEARPYALPRRSTPCVASCCDSCSQSDCECRCHFQVVSHPSVMDVHDALYRDVYSWK